jgi:hypothetical protein
MKEFVWRSGHANGDLEEEELHLPTRSYEQGILPKRHHWGDDDDNGDRDQARSRSFINRMANWMDGRNKSRGSQLERGRSRNWFRGESSGCRYRHNRDDSVPPSRDRSPPEERRALRQLYQSKSSSSSISYKNVESIELVSQVQSKNAMPRISDAIEIYPTEIDFEQLGQSQKELNHCCTHIVQESGVITIATSASFVGLEESSPPKPRILCPEKTDSQVP